MNRVAVLHCIKTKSILSLCEWYCEINYQVLSFENLEQF